MGLYVLYEIYLHENVKTTPFYRLVLDLLSRKEVLHAAEQKLLTDFLQSVPRIAKQTPSQYIREAEKTLSVPVPVPVPLDLEPYRKAHVDNMPAVSLLHAASLSPLLTDFMEIDK